MGPIPKFPDKYSLSIAEDAPEADGGLYKNKTIGRLSDAASLSMYANIIISSRRRHTSLTCDWSSDVCSSDLGSSSSGPNVFLLGTELYLPENYVSASPIVNQTIFAGTTLAAIGLNAGTQTLFVPSGDEIIINVGP